MNSLIDAPMTAGVNLKPEHYQDAINFQTPGLWYEVHTENYFVDGGPRIQYLKAFSERVPISFHGVGASLGGLSLPDAEHLNRVSKLVKEFNPILVSEHATWSSYQGQYFADLLPLPKTRAALQSLIEGIDAYQNAIGRNILIENPTNYLDFISEMDEPDFLIEAANRTGAGILLDVNNLYLSNKNCGLDIEDYIHRLPSEKVGEIHIAGFSQDANFTEQGLLIDSHDSDVAEPVWQLLEKALTKFKNTPVLLERDGNIPSFGELISERNRAHDLISEIDYQGRLNHV